MQQVQSGFPAGSVIIPTSGTPRFQEFYECFEALRVPAGTRRIRTKSSDIVRALNTACDQLCGDWAFFLGDDHTFDPDLVLRLLGHNLPAVVALNIAKQPPFGPMLLKGALREMPAQMEWADVPAGDGLWYLPENIHTGNNAMLVRRDVLERIEKPIWRAGQVNPGILNEDFWFWHSLRELGVPVVVDLGARVGHLNNFAAVPIQRDGKWSVVLAQDGKAVIERRG